MTRRKPSPPTGASSDTGAENTPTLAEVANIIAQIKGGPPVVTITPFEASAILEYVATLEVAVAAYSLGRGSWDDLLYRVSCLAAHLRALFAYQGAIPEPPVAPPEAVAESLDEEGMPGPDD